MQTGKTVLLVDDNPSVLLLMERALASEGYELLTAADGEAALLAIGEEGRTVDLLVADLVLPRVGGLELASRMTERDPRLPVIFVSGYAGEDEASTGILTGRVAFLGKPFSAAVFRAKVKELLAEPGHGSPVEPKP